MAKKEPDEKPAMDPRLRAMAQFASTVDRKFGRGAMASASEAAQLDKMKISTGALSLDYALGGGVPKGRITLFYGKRSGGKTLNAMRVIAKAQTLCRNCFRPAQNLVVKEETIVLGEGKDKQEKKVWYAEAFCDCYEKGLFVPGPYQVPDSKGVLIEEDKKEFAARIKRYEKNSYEEMICGLLDTEGTHDREWAERLGVDNRRLYYDHPQTAEELVDVYDPWLRTGAVDLVVLDTIAFMTPRKEIEASAEEWQQGLQARLVNKLCRKISAANAACARQWRRMPTQIWCNQVRAKIGGYGDGETLPGGMGQEFSASIEVKFWPTQPEVEQIKAGNKGEEITVPLWVDIRFKVTKNKMAPSSIEGFYRMILTDTESRRKGDISEDDTLFRWAKHYELVSKDDDDKWCYDGQTYRTQAELQEILRRGPERDRLKSLLMSLLTGGTK